jgi:cell division initiation protein
LDIQNKKFKKTFRGYSEEEVDFFLEQIVQEFEKLYRLNRELEDRLAESDSSMDRYREMEDVLKKTLVAAQQSAEEQRANTRQECRLLLEEARLQAQNELQEANARVKEAIAEYHNIRQQVRVFRVRFRSFIEAHLKLLDEPALDAAATLDRPADQVAGIVPGHETREGGLLLDEDRPTGR